MPTKLPDDAIKARIRLANEYLEPFRGANLAAAQRYIDLNGVAAGDNMSWELLSHREIKADIPSVIPIGQTNWQAINTEIKSAAIAMNAPRIHVKCNEPPPKPQDPNKPHQKPQPSYSQIVAKALEDMIEQGGWVREFEAALQQYSICGLATMRYRWDKQFGPDIDHVTSNRLLVQPHPSNWKRLPWGGVKVQMTLREAIELYDPKGRRGFFAEFNDSMDDQEALDRDTVVISIYQEMNGDEAHVHEEDVVFRGKNLYRKVPLKFMLSFNDPRDKSLPMGDNVFAGGLADEVNTLHTQAASVAKHGQPVTIGSSQFWSKSEQVALAEGKPQGVTFTEKQINPQSPPLWRLPAEQLSEAWAMATRETMSALMAIQGVDVTARGEAQPGVTATQAVMAQSKGGAMPTKMRARFEAFWNEILTEVVWMVQQFGGPGKGEKVTTAEDLVHEAFKSVYEVSVIEGSTSFQTPTSDQQGCMQLLTTTAQTMGAFESLAARGAIDRIPNLLRLYEDCLQAFARADVDQYESSPPAAPPAENQIPPDIVKWMQQNYGDAAEDIKRQIELRLGFKPSQIQQQPDNYEETGKLADLHAEASMADAKHAHEKEMQQSQHAHDMQRIGAETAKELVLRSVSGNSHEPR